MRGGQGEKFVNELDVKVLMDLATELNRNDKWKEFLAICEDSFQLSDTERHRLTSVQGFSVLDSAGFRILYQLGDNGMRVAQCIEYLDQLRMEPALLLIKAPERLEITEQPANVTNVREGGTIMLVCVAQGFPYPQYRWFHKPANPAHKKHVVVGVGSTMLVKEASLSNAGQYKCLVHNSHEYVYSQLARVYVKQHTSSQKGMGRATEHLEEPKAVPVPHEMKPSRGAEQGTYDDPGGAMADCGHDQTSVAAVWNPPVQQAPGFAPRACSMLRPRINEHPQSMQVQAHHTAVLTCKVESDSPLRFHWRKDNKSLQTNRLHGVEGELSPQLIIHDCMDFHVGSYHCIVSNDYGEESTNPARLAVFCHMDNLEIVKNVRSKTLEVGEICHFDVDVRCPEYLTYQWFHGPKELPGEVGPKCKFHVTGLDQAGYYQCMITTESGRRILSDKAKLSVRARSLMRPKDKVALVIGNSDYSSPGIKELPAVVNDIAVISEQLSQLGFKVHVFHNLDKCEMERAIDDFCALLTKEVYGVFSFSGHGFVDEAGRSYLLPCDAQLESQDQAVCVNSVLSRMQLPQPLLLLFILDICRNIADYLDPTYRPPKLSQLNNNFQGNMFLLYATSLGMEALEKHDNSVLVSCLKNVLLLPVDLYELFKQVQKSLRKLPKANKQQFPYIESNMKDPCMLSDPISTSGSTMEMNENYLRWKEMKDSPEDLSFFVDGWNFNVHFQERFTNVLHMTITPNGDVRDLELFLVDVPPEVDMVPAVKNKYTYVISNLQKVRRPLEIQLRVNFVSGTRHYGAVKLDLGWPLAAAWGKRFCSDSRDRSYVLDYRPLQH